MPSPKPPASSPKPPLLAVLTPTGRGAIATLALRGPSAIALVARLFLPAAGRPLESFKIGRVVFGRLHMSTSAAEDLVVGLVTSDEVEIHCHGGAAAVAAVRDALVAAGCRLVSPHDWAHESESDPLQAEALLALADARTERVAAILLDQYRGALRQELNAIEATIARQDMAAAIQITQSLLARAPLGLHLTRPWQVVLAGQPNAGKSSLINALLGYQRAIVWHEPGTTRDVLTATTAIDGWPVELADTAGLREPGESIEAAGVARAAQQILAADLVLFVADTTGAWDEDLFRSVSQQPLLVVHNKCDLSPPPADGRPSGLHISAKTGAGLESLCTAISQRLAPSPPPPGAAVPFTAAQIAALEALNAQLTSRDLVAAGQFPLFQLQ